MRTRLLALALAGGMLLTGCESMLERSYESTARHEEKPVTAGDSSAVRVENYRELVSAVLYLVSQGQEEGTIQLWEYAGDVETDLTAACLEVATEDPLGAYAVDYIKHECTRVVSYYQAEVSIRYRRTLEQIRSVVNVTGSSAIRDQLQEALSDFASEAVLRVAYFSGDAGSITELVRQAYYDTPAAALGMPEVEVALYPDSGRERVVEILLSYARPAEELQAMSRELSERTQSLSVSFRELEGQAASLRAAAVLKNAAVYDGNGGSDAYAALVEGQADSEGMALAYELLCQQAGVACEVVEGTLGSQRWFWNAVTIGTGERLYLDPVYGNGLLREGEYFTNNGYRWGDELTGTGEKA